MLFRYEIPLVTYCKFNTGISNELATQRERTTVYKLALVYFVYHGAAPIPYVPAAILNLPQLRSTTVVTNFCSKITNIKHTKYFRQIHIASN